MKKISVMPFVAFVLSMFCVGCVSSDDNDEWNEKGWRNEGYPMISYKGKNYIKVPYDGGTYVFHYNKTDYLWLTEHLFIVDGQTTTASSSDINHYSNGWCDIKAQGDSLKVTFGQNEDLARKAHVGVTSGDVNEVFRFYQESPYYAKRGHNPERFIGDWVQNPNVEIGGIYNSGQYRYSFNEDGTYICTFENYADGGVEVTRYDGDWLDFCNYLYVKYYKSSSVERWMCDVSDDKLELQYIEDGAKIPFVRVEKSGEPVQPIFSLEVKPSKSALPTTLMPGEPYTLECSIVAKGNNYELSNVKLIRQTYSNEQRPAIYEWDKDLRTDTIDVSEYAKEGYTFSLPMSAPEKNHSVKYEFRYDCRYTSVNNIDRRQGKDVLRRMSNSLTTSFRTRE